MGNREDESPRSNPASRACAFSAVSGSGSLVAGKAAGLSAERMSVVFSESRAGACRASMGERRWSKQGVALAKRAGDSENGESASLLDREPNSEEPAQVPWALPCSSPCVSTPTLCSLCPLWLNSLKNFLIAKNVASACPGTLRYRFSAPAPSPIRCQIDSGSTGNSTRRNAFSICPSGRSPCTTRSISSL